MSLFIHDGKRDRAQRSERQRSEQPCSASHGLALLPCELLVKTGPFDHAGWNYQGLLGYLQRQRYYLARRLLPPRRVDRILEIGYGSGVFMPELQEHCDTLDGVDVHAHKEEVTPKLRHAGVSATLHTASAEDLPFDDRTFDVAVAVSTLEFVHDISRSAREISRVLRPGGAAIVVTPGDHPLLDWGLWLATGESAKRDFSDRRTRLIPALAREMRLDKRISFPLAFPGFPTLYIALRFLTLSASSR
jgi:SAM-dependent methyltransferase